MTNGTTQKTTGSSNPLHSGRVRRARYAAGSECHASHSAHDGSSADREAACGSRCQSSKSQPATDASSAGSGPSLVGSSNRSAGRFSWTKSRSSQQNAKQGSCVRALRGSTRFPGDSVDTSQCCVHTSDRGRPVTSRTNHGERQAKSTIRRDSAFKVHSSGGKRTQGGTAVQHSTGSSVPVHCGVASSVTGGHAANTQAAVEHSLRRRSGPLDPSISEAGVSRHQVTR